MTTFALHGNAGQPAELQDHRSFEYLVAPHIPLLRRFVGRRVQNWHDAEDTFQQTLVLAFRHMGQFRFESSSATWLCRIAINVIRGRFRRPEARNTIAVDMGAMESMARHDQQPSALAMMERKELSRRLREAIAKLPESYRSVVELRDIHGLSVRETADSLFLSAPAVKSRHHRARSLLSDLMQDATGGGPKRQAAA